MSRTDHLKEGFGYIVEGPKCIFMTYVCDRGYNRGPRGLCLRVRKSNTPDGDEQLHFSSVPNNVIWANGKEVSVAQIKAAMHPYANNLHFWVAEYHMTAGTIQALMAFYGA